MRFITVIAMALALAGAPGGSASSSGAGQQDEFTTLEAEAVRTLSGEPDSFAIRAAFVDRLQSAAERAPTLEQRGRLTLVWLQLLRGLVASIPFRGDAQQPYRSWLAEHEASVIYSEPAGEWLLFPDTLWKIHDAHRSTPSADEIAWLVVINGYPGECEGYVPCYANVLNWLDGEYLRRHPNGTHASDAVEQIRSSLDQAVNLLSGPSTTDFLNPTTDCDDLRAGLVPLRAAVLNSSGRDRTEIEVLIDRLLSHCQP